MDEKSRRYDEFFRTQEYNKVLEYNNKRAISGVDDSLSDMDFDESTHRKNGYASTLSTSRRDKQKDTNKIVAVATAGTVSLVTIVAVILAAVVGVSFLSFSATENSVICRVDIPEDMQGNFTGILYDAEGTEVSRCETSGFGELEFAFTELSPDTEYYFSIFDAENKQYLYETVKTAVSSQPDIAKQAAEYNGMTQCCLRT